MKSLDYKHFVKKGNQVIFHYKRLTKNPIPGEENHIWIHAWKRAVILSQPRHWRNLRFTKDYEDATVKVRFEDGEREVVDVEDLEADVEPSVLSKEEVIRLYNEICRGSMFLDDYKNSLGVFQEVACSCYDSFLEYVAMCDEKDVKDTAEEFYYYLSDCECCRPII